MGRNFAIVSLLFLAAFASTQGEKMRTLSADEIMARVAANQDRAEEQRKQCVYKQHIRVISRKTNGKLMREESADYDVFPVEQSSQKKLKQLTGRYWHKGGYLNYSAEPVPEWDSVDGEIVTAMRNDLANERRSKDGLATSLFPLTSKEQQPYRFKVLGEQALNGRSVFHIGFEPKDETDIVWKGEAFIDQEAFQPVLVITQLSRKVPFLVRTALGTIFRIWDSA